MDDVLLVELGLEVIEREIAQARKIDLRTGLVTGQPTP